jgi:hypothetical protein
MPAAGKRPGLAPAADAKTQPLDRDAELPLPAAAGAGRLDHGGGARAGKRADEPQDTGEGSAGALAGEQLGPACHGGCDAAPPVRAPPPPGPVPRGPLPG